MAIATEEVAESVRAWCTAIHTRDIPTVVTMEAQAGGFGYRQLSRRDHVAVGEAERTQVMDRFYGQMEYYRLELEELQTSVTGDVGLAWGAYTEEFQEKGRPPERARVRFSKVLTKTARGWQIVLYHRDIQPFAADGRYSRELTVVSPVP